MSAAVTAWQGLSSDQRDAWHLYAQQTPWHNALGEDVHLTAFNSYISVRMGALWIDPTYPVADFNTPPCTPGVLPTPLLQAADYDIFPPGSIGIKLNLTNLSDVDSIRFRLIRSAAQNLSINFWKGPYDPRAIAGPITVAAGATQAFYFNNLTLGKRYFIRLRGVHSVNHNRISNLEYYQQVSESS